MAPVETISMLGSNLFTLENNQILKMIGFKYIRDKLHRSRRSSAASSLDDSHLGSGSPQSVTPPKIIEIKPPATRKTRSRSNSKTAKPRGDSMTLSSLQALNGKSMLASPTIECPPSPGSELHSYDEPQGYFTTTTGMANAPVPNYDASLLTHEFILDMPLRLISTNQSSLAHSNADAWSYNPVEEHKKVRFV